MQSNVLTKAIDASADPIRAKAVIGQLQDTSAASLLKKLKAVQAQILCAVLAGSAASSELLVAHPDWLARCSNPALSTILVPVRV